METDDIAERLRRQWGGDPELDITGDSVFYREAANEIDQLRSAIRLAHAGWPWSATKFQWLQLSIVHATLMREGKDNGNG